MKPLHFAALALCGTLATACNSQPAGTTETAQTEQTDTPEDVPAKNTPATETAETTDQRPAEPTPQYEIHGVLDPGLNNMVAFALKAPWAWQMQQSFTRQWSGSVPINQIYFRLTAPDGSAMFESLPSAIYHYTDGPMTRNLRQTAASMGMQQPPAPGEAAPMPPLTYLKKMLLPQLAQRGLSFRPSGEHSAPRQQAGSGKSTASAYVDGQLADGRKVRVSCGISYTTTNMNGEIYTTWEVSPTVTMTTHDLAACYAHTQQALASITLNPDWQQKTSQLARSGFQANDDINRRTAEQNRDYREHQRRVNDEVVRQRDESNDRNHRAFRDALGGEGQFENPSTGERTRTTDFYAHVYKDREGNVYGSHTPLDAGSLDWQELQRVEMKNY